MVKNNNNLSAGYEIGEDVKTDLDYLLRVCAANLSVYDEQLIIKAFHWCVDAHKKVVRKSGKPFYTHPLSVALIVAGEIPLDDISVVSALLHEIIHTKNQYNINDIRLEFGPTIAEIVEAITKIQRIDTKAIEQIENYRKLLLSLFKDVRIILIKLADTLHNMRTLEHLSYVKQMERAERAMSIYVPFAHRFGLGRLKLEMEDLAFKHLNRKEYEKIERRINLTWDEREEYIRTFTNPIRDRLAKVELMNKKKISYAIYGRAKHIFSIFNKMHLREKDMDELYDLFAVRIILDTEDSGYCFLVYGIVSEIYKPVPGTFKNYISSPKKNGYRSIHTAVVGPDGKYVEVQIRTKEMHRVSEKGVAAHFKYKRGFLPAQSVLDDQNLEEWMNLVRNVFENIGEDEPPEQLLDSVRKNLFLDEIYVFTPSKEFRILPKDATPLDFAFNIHSDIGMHCIGAKVNGKVTPLDYKLQSGDQVEILTSKNQKPLKEWLKLAVTQRAKYYLHKYFKEERNESIITGKSLLKQTAGENSRRPKEYELDRIVNILKLKNKDELFYKVGARKIQTSLVFDLLKEIREHNGIIQKENLDDDKSEQINPVNNTPLKKSSLPDYNLPIVYADCCLPVPGDRITVITEEEEMIIHRTSCEKIKAMLGRNNPSVSEIEWSSLKAKDYSARIKINGSNDSKLLNEISSVILSIKNTSIKSVNIENIEDGFKGRLTLGVESQEHLNSIIVKLLALEGIQSVDRD